MRSASLGKKILCIFMVDFSIDPRAQTLGPPLKEVDFPQEEFLLAGLERVNCELTYGPIGPMRSVAVRAVRAVRAIRAIRANPC